jgi:hypothetical protein
MKRHEQRCTGNPDRVCGMCKMVEGEQKPLAELVAVFDGWVLDDSLCYAGGDMDEDLEGRIERLSDLTERCPACMLAAARAVQAKYPPESNCWINVEYKWRRDEWLSELNERNKETDNCYEDGY